MKRIALVITILINGIAYAQDLNFSQFQQLPLLRNPALAGVFDGDIRVNSVYRNQWQSITVPFRSTALSVEYKIPFLWNDYFTIGLQATHDIAGDIKLKRTQLLPVINYHKSLSGNADDYLSLAFMAGPVQSQFDPSQLKMDEQFQNGSYNPGAPVNPALQRTGFSYWDASTGLSFSSGFGDDNRYYLGAALFHLNKPKVSFYTSNSNVELDPKYVFNAGLNFRTSDLNKVLMFADYLHQGGNSQAMGGIFYSIEISRDYETEEAVAIEFGGMYRWNDALIPSVKLEYKKFSFGMSYDVNVSKLRTVSQLRGGIEVTAAFNAKLISRNYYAERMRCVRF